MAEPEVELPSEGEREGQADEGAEEEEEAQRGEPSVLYPAVKEEWYRDRDVELGFDVVDFDLLGVQGQARPFSKQVFEERLREMRTALPVGLLKVTVWPADIHGVSSTEEARVFKSLFSPPQIGSSWCSRGSTAAEP